MQVDQEHYTNPPPGKAESLLTRMNTPAHDPGAVRGGGSGQALSPGQIASAFACRQAMRVPEAERLVGETVARRAIYDLAMYRHTLDRRCYGGIWSAAMLIITSVCVEQRWRKPERGIMTRVAETAIEDVCSPAKYRGLSERQWCRMLQLGGQTSWQRTWRHRYDQIRQIIQALDEAGEAQVARRI